MQTDDAELRFLEDGTPFSDRYGDVYRSRSGAGQAALVFVAGSRVRERLERSGRISILETGFGLGLNMVATMRAAAALPGGARIRFDAIELHPVRPSDLERAHADSGPEGAELVRCYGRLADQGRATLEVGDVRVELRLVVGDGAHALRALEAPVDAVFLDGFSPDRNPGLWNDDVYAEIARLSRAGTTIATYTVARDVRRGLRAAGFAIERAPGFGDKRERIVGIFEGGRPS